MKIFVIGYGLNFRALIEGCLLTKNKIVGVLRVNRVRYSKLTNYFMDNFSPDEDKLFVNRYNLNDVNESSVNSQSFRKTLIKLNPDIVFVASWCEKFAPETFNIPPLGTINLHPSLLPKYRGPNPYAQVIKHGEKETGITFHLMDKDFDSGTILHQKSIPISHNETGESLRLKCSIYAKEETFNILNKLENGYIEPIEQKKEEATYFRQLKLEDSILSFTTETSEQIDRRIRALTPWIKCSIPCGNEFFMFKSHKITEKITSKPFATILGNDGKKVRISTTDKKIMEFDEVYPVRYIPPFLHKWYVKKYLVDKAK